MNALTLLRLKNKVLGAIAPDRVARSAARMFLTPRQHPAKDWEKAAEQECKRYPFGQGLSAAIWGQGERKILVMHGWESRATQMAAIVLPLVSQGYQVIAIDAPGHGRSSGDKSNPVAFAQAILAAEAEFGPFYAAVGHSMGGAAVALALTQGLQVQRCVLVASPARVLDTLLGFAGFIGLSKRCTERFVRFIEEEVGYPAKELDVVRAVSRVPVNTLLVHSSDDREVAFSSVQAIHKASPESELFCPENLGHRRIIRDPDVAERIGLFLLARETA